MNILDLVPKIVTKILFNNDYKLNLITNTNYSFTCSNLNALENNSFSYFSKLTTKIFNQGNRLLFNLDSYSLKLFDEQK